MAVPPKTDEAFLREVDEELRRDQLTNFWTRYGVWLVIAIVGGLAVFGGFLYWRHSQTVQAGVDGEQMQSVIEKLEQNPKSDVAKPLQDLAGSKIDAYRATAKFAQADQLLEKQDMKGAIAKFAEIVADTSLAQPFRDLALIRQTSAEFDTIKPQVVVDRLRPLAVKDNPWFGSAGELVAAAYLRLNQNDQAGQMFAGIARDDHVPGSIRQRAVEMAGALGVDAVDQPEEKKAQ